MSSDILINLKSLSKCYQIYNKPNDRLKQFVIPRAQRLLGRQPKQYFREFWALKDISFEVKRGETVGIIGRNGSGKSTLLQLICGTLNTTCGSIQTIGRIAALLELGSGFNPEFTGRENVYMNGALLGLSEGEIDQRFDSIEAFAEIGDFIDQPVKSYSSGMLVRLAFAVIAHVDADILIIDEALAVGDAFFTQKCFRFLRSFMNKGTVLFVSHDTSSIRSLCERVIWLDKGQMKAIGTAKDVSEMYLESLFEAQQDINALIPVSNILPGPNLKDQRHEIINSSALRNDIQLFSFGTNVKQFGSGAARIANVFFTDINGHSLSWFVGGENVILQIVIEALTTLEAPIVGFYIKDKVGQYLFGDNTFITTQLNPVICDENQQLKVAFHFQMPRLAVGDYSVAVAVANGTQDDHVQHHWIHDAVTFRSERSSVVGGLVGIPMTAIEIAASHS